MTQSDHPLGAPAATDDAPVLDLDKSIVDTVLDLDALLSADVRRAERIARICTRPDLEARLDELEAELQDLTDPQGRPLIGGSPGGDRAIGEDSATAEGPAEQKAREIEAVRVEMKASMQSVRMRQVPDDDWAAWEKTWRAALDEGSPYPNEMWNDLITMSAIVPPISADQVVRMRAVLGRPTMLELGQTAWAVNVSSGVSVPKSSLSSAVLRRAGLATS